MKLRTLLPLTLTLLAAPDALAYNLKATSAGAQVHWSRHVLPLVVLESGNPSKDALLLRAVRGAAQQWAKAANVIVDIQVAAPGTTDIGFNAKRTNTSVIRWADGDWTYDAGTLGLTFLRYDVESGAILDADILINDVHFEWTDKMSVEQDNGKYDLQNTVTHELGHAIGLGHSGVDEATMFPATDPSDTQKRQLDDDDTDGAQQIYGEPSPDGNLAAPIAPPTGGCTSTPGSTDPMLALMIILAAWGLLRRRQGLAGLMLVAMMATPAFASELAVKRAPVTFDKIVARSDAVVRGTVVEQSVEKRTDGVLLTISKVRVDACVAGTCPRTVVLEQLGGELDGVGFMVEGVTPVRTGESLIFAARTLGARWEMVAHDHGRLLSLQNVRAVDVRRLESKVAQAYLAR